MQAGQALVGALQAFLGLFIAGVAGIVDTEIDVDPGVERVAAEGFLVIREGIDAGIVELLEPLCGEQDFLDTAVLLGLEGPVRGMRPLQFVLDDGGVTDQFAAAPVIERGEEIRILDGRINGNILEERRVRVDIEGPLQQDAVAGLDEHLRAREGGGGIEADHHGAGVLAYHVHGAVEGDVLGAADLLDGIPVLLGDAYLIRADPAVVRLVVGEGADHQFEVGAVLFGKHLVPDALRAPEEEFLAGHDVVVGPVGGTGVLAEIIADQIILVVVDREGGIAAGKADPPAVVRGIGIAADAVHRPVGILGLAVRRPVDRLRRELHLVVLVGVDRDVGPVQEGLHHRGAVLDLERGLEIGLPGEHRQADRPFQPLAEFGLADPDGLAAVLVLDDFITGVERGGGPVVVGDVPLHAAGDPGPDHADQGRPDDMLAVEEVVAGLLVAGGEDAAADLGQDPDLGVLILQGQVLVVPIHPVIGEVVIDGVGIDVPGGTLVGAPGEEVGIQFGITDQVGRNGGLRLADLDLSAGTHGKQESKDQDDVYGGPSHNRYRVVG